MESSNARIVTAIATVAIPLASWGAVAACAFAWGGDGARLTLVVAVMAMISSVLTMAMAGSSGTPSKTGRVD